MYWKNRQRLRILFARSPRLGLGSLMRWKMVSGRQAKRSGMVAMLPKTQSRKRNTPSSRGHYRQWAQFLRPGHLGRDLFYLGRIPSSLSVGQQKHCTPSQGLGGLWKTESELSRPFHEKNLLLSRRRCSEAKNWSGTRQPFGFDPLGWIYLTEDKMRALEP